MYRQSSTRSYTLIFYACVLLAIGSCSKSPDALFVLLSSEDTGLEFNNTIVENDSFNILTEEYIYNGGGVAVGDFNNDDLPDLFFTGNQVPNRLFLNRGEMKFGDVTESTNVNRPGTWNSGAVVVDINNDGLDDLYVTATMKHDSASRANMLFLNKGLSDKGVPQFEEVASQYGIADVGYSTSAAFFDYDLDGDLDLYVLTNQHLNFSPAAYRKRIDDGTAANNDRLYRNDGNGKFTNVTLAAGIVYEGYGLGLAISDVNGDGWPDIYVSNDFLSNDVLYINNGNGTFTNNVRQYIAHQSHSSMGNDAADFNNDGRPDIVTLDMLPETNARKKTTINNKNYSNYINNEKYDHEYQFVRNMLHVNNGAEDGIRFSEVGQLSGIHQTEWSWSPLFADFDNDGYKDLLVTNGFPKDITDKDFSNYREDVERYVKISNLIDSIPEIKIQNYAFRNTGGLKFEDVSEKWGFIQKSFSNGAAFVDLDNDGDLDYVVNNINDNAFIYENTTDKKLKTDAAHFLRIKLEGNDNNRQALGSKVFIYTQGKTQFYEHYVARGYLSSVERTIHFGLGASHEVDSIIIEWPKGERQKLSGIKADQVLTVKYSPESTDPKTRSHSEEKLFKEVSGNLKVNFKHHEDDRIDFNIQRTLPHKFTQFGPGASVGDVNGDSREDFVVGGSYGVMTSLFLQQSDGTFKRSAIQGNITKAEEDEGLLLFDADNDNDLDLYIVSGSIESAPTSELYGDQLWKNDGSGSFTLDKTALPAETSSGSCVRGADFDADGDIDLFVGGRIVPGEYPFAPKSFLLQNDGGRFSDVTSVLGPELSSIGMVTDGLFTDFDNDGKADIITVGEFMAITLFRNEGGKFRKLEATGLENYKGWWNSISAGDFDRDGDMDYIAGNLGNNNNYQVQGEHPLEVIAKDFDGNGSIDAILGCYVKESLENKEMKLFPVHFWDELNSQSPKFRRQFGRYKQYGKTTLTGLFKPQELEGALRLSANHFSSSYVENLGDGKFKLSVLPEPVQVAPVNGISISDFDGDGNLDVALVGNDYGNEVFAGRYDAFTGLILHGDGSGKFETVSSGKSGFFVPGDAKALVKLSGDGGEFLIATQNLDSLRIFSTATPQSGRTLTPEKGETHAIVNYTDGRKQRIEFYYGAGYLSQPTRKFIVGRGVNEVTFFNAGMQTRKVNGAMLLSQLRDF